MCGLFWLATKSLRGKLCISETNLMGFVVEPLQWYKYELHNMYWLDLYELDIKHFSCITSRMSHCNKVVHLLSNNR